MPSTRTTRTGLEKQAAGENPSTWGDPLLNNNFDRIDVSTKGVTAFALSGSVVLTSSTTSTTPANYQNIFAVLHASSGTGGTITVPALQASWVVVNGTSGNAVVSNGSSSVTLYPGETATVATNGTLMWKHGQNDAGGLRLRNLAAPVDTTDAATKAYADSIVASGLPSQTGKSGQYLTTNGTVPSWAAVFPSFSGTTDYILTSSGSAAVWSAPATVRSKLGLGALATLSTAPIANGGTGATTAATARTNLGLAIGTNVQPYSANLTAIDAVSLSSGVMLYYAGSGTWAASATTNFSRSLIATSGQATARTVLGLGGASVLDVGTTAGTVAAGDDSRIVGAAPLASPTFTGTPSIGSEKLMRVATGTAANSGRWSFGTGAPGALALGEFYGQYT